MDVVLDIVYGTLLFWATPFLQAYTALVIFAGTLWTRWWGILLGCLTLLSIAANFVAFASRPFVVDMLPFLSLERRLLHRAMTIALRQLVGHYEAALEAREAHSLETPPSFLYTRLHNRLSYQWRMLADHPFDIGRFSIYVQIPVLLAAMSLTIGTGSCLPAWMFPIPVLGNFSWTMFGVLGTTGRNGVLETVAGLYGAARLRLRQLACEAALSSERRGERHLDLSAQLARHDGVLESFAEIERYRGRILGVPVSLGLVRTVLVTAFTVAIGLWSVFRDLGLFVTVQVFCPAV